MTNHNKSQKRHGFFKSLFSNLYLRDMGEISHPSSIETPTGERKNHKIQNDELVVDLMSAVF